MKVVYTILLGLFCCISHAQREQVGVQFQFVFNSEIIQVGEKYYLKSIDDSVSVESLRMYISDFKFCNNAQLLDSTEKKFFLIDLDNKQSQYITLHRRNNLKFNQLKFNVGADSLTNVSGARGGDLDPTKGMYWTWQSGYINFKIEGKSNSCPSRNHMFQFHIGGYQNPYNTFRQVTLQTNSKRKIVITVAVDELLSRINLKETYEVMSPNAKAVEIANLFPFIFSISK